MMTLWIVGMVVVVVRVLILGYNILMRRNMVMVLRS